MDSASNSASVPATSSSVHSGRNTMLVRLDDILECCICRQDLQDALLCGLCSKPFCRKCIVEWLRITPRCPHCRGALTEQEAAELVTVRTFDQLEVVADEQQNRCQPHHRELLFFCSACKECLCDKCMFEEPHVVHKDRVVLIDMAIDDLKQNISEDFKWIVCCVDRNKQLLEQIQEMVDKNHALASVMLENSETIEKEKNTAFTVQQLITFKKEMKLLKSQSRKILTFLVTQPRGSGVRRAST